MRRHGIVLGRKANLSLCYTSLLPTY